MSNNNNNNNIPKYNQVLFPSQVAPFQRKTSGLLHLDAKNMIQKVQPPCPLHLLITKPHALPVYHDFLRHKTHITPFNQ